MKTLILGILKDQEGAKEQLRTSFDSFREIYPTKDHSALEGRVIDSFAFCYAAGVLAIHLKILPWSIRGLRGSIQSCLEDALALIPNPIKETKATAEAILGWIHDDANLLQSKCVTIPDAKEYDGIRLVRAKNDAPMFLFRDDRMKRQFGNERYLHEALALLRERKRLMTDKKRPGIFTKQFPSPDGAKLRFYCFVEGE